MNHEYDPADIITGDDNTPIVLMVTGQSNTTGERKTGGERGTINANLYFWEEYPTAEQTKGWKRAGPASPDWPHSTTGNSFAYHAANIIQRMTGRIVLVVQQAKGGTPISEFTRPGTIPGATGLVWKPLKQAMEAALASVPPGRSDNKTLTQLGVAGADCLMMHQGEWDAIDILNAANPNDREPTASGTDDIYEERFRLMVAQMKEEGMLKQFAPVIIGQLLTNGNYYGLYDTDDRNGAIERMGLEDRLIRTVSTEGLVSDDSVHLDGASLVELGRRYACAFMAPPKDYWVERGSKNGTTWEKYSDGRLVFRNQNIGTVATDKATAVPGVFQSGTMTWTYPTGADVPKFINATDITVTGKHIGDSARWITNSAAFVGSATFNVMRLGSSDYVRVTGARAEGRWRV